MKLLPSAQSPSRNEDFFNTSKIILKKEIEVFP